MRRRYEAALAFISKARLEPGLALRQSMVGYTRRDFGADVMAGLVVGVVALPLSLALAIASGVPPQHGLYTAIVAGGLTAVLGGSRVLVTGPTAAFVVILAPIAAQFGVGGLLLATLMAGVIQVFMGVVRLGRLIEFIPHPVTTGFTTGIATVIASLQLKDFLGLTLPRTPEHFTERIALIVQALPTVRPGDVIVGVATLSILLVWPRITKRVPGPLIALAAGGVLAALLARLAGWDIATIGSRFSYLVDGVSHRGIPALPPVPLLPWHLPGPDGQPVVLSLALIRTLVGPAFAIAILGAIESLLGAVVADGMAGTKHDPDVELVAQGSGNIVAPFFGGIAATGAIARTATNIRAGGRTPIAAVVHSLFVLASVLLLAPALAYLPMASLAALLLMVAWNMSEVRHFGHIVRVAPRSDTFVLLTCFFLTVVFDMVISVAAGVMLASLLFMRRMADISKASIVTETSHLEGPLPKGVVLYEIAGPLFFGAAQKAMSALATVSAPARVVIIHMGAVPAMDVTGLVALESVLEELFKTKHLVILAGVQEQPAGVLEKAGIVNVEGKLAICSTLEAAVALASERRRPTSEWSSTGMPTQS